MGREEVDENITKEIGENVEYLNQEFEGKVKFELNFLALDPSHSFIPDLHEAHLKQDRKEIESRLSSLEQAGGINIYLFDTYVKNEARGAMMGFTPVLTQFYESYSKEAPRFDRLFISYPGLIDKSTIVHEMGHFLGLSHPWEMSHIDRDLMGFYGPEAETNHMTYHPDVDNFSDEQLARMQHFALHFRKYLLARTETQLISTWAMMKNSSTTNHPR